jgi:hypothetical protein
MGLASRRRPTRSKPKLRTFDRESVNRMLPLLRQIVGDMRDAYGILQDRRNSITKLRAEGLHDSQQFKLAKHDVEVAAKRLTDSVVEIEELGGLVRDPERGLLDFHAEQPIDLPNAGLSENATHVFCWRPDDREVCFGHRADGECDNRQMIPNTPRIDA